MECPLLLNPDDGGELIDLHNHFKLAGIRRWWSGVPIPQEKRVNISNPVILDYEPLRGYDGLPPEMDDIGIPVMSKRLFRILAEAGVENIEAFPALLRNTVTNEYHEYVIYNIIGKVPRDHMADSNSHIFRLMEDVSAIMVHESIKQKIEDSGITTIEFINMEDYVQI